MTEQHTLLDNAALTGIRSYLPDRVMSNTDLEKIVDTSDSWIFERTGIRTRHVVTDGETASTIGAHAAQDLLTSMGNPTIDLILSATCSPDTLIPSTSCLIQRQLGLPGVPAMDINAACSGFAYGIATARSMIKSGFAHRILLITTEAMSTLVDYSDRSTCVLFGDGAAAVMIESTTAAEMIHPVLLGANGAEAPLIAYQDLEHTQTPGISMKGRETYRGAVDKMTTMINKATETAGWTLEDVDHIIPHQANARIVEAVAHRMHLPLSRFVSVIDHMGNTSSASIPLAIHEAARGGRFSDGDRIICIAFGAGSTWGGFGLTWSSTCSI